MEENESIVTWPTELELKDAHISIPTNNSPGPNGFGSGFFITCWEFIRGDLLEVA